MFTHKNDDGWDLYVDSETLPSGQTIKIEFYEEDTSRKIYYGIYLCTMNKRKSEYYSVLHTTGKDGVLGLLWAKRKIAEFETFILEDERKKKPIVIYCFWDDNRRRDVYQWGLRSLGFNYGKIFNKRALVKEIQ